MSYFGEIIRVWSDYFWWGNIVEIIWGKLVFWKEMIWSEEGEWCERISGGREGENLYEGKMMIIFVTRFLSPL